MRKLIERCTRFLKEEDGPTAVEYAVVLALILLVCFAAVRTVGTSTSQSLQNSANSIAS